MTDNSDRWVQAYVDKIRNEVQKLYSEKAKQDFFYASLLRLIWHAHKYCILHLAAIDWNVKYNPIGHRIHHYNNDCSHDHNGDIGIKIKIMRNYVTVIIAANSIKQ